MDHSGNSLFEAQSPLPTDARDFQYLVCRQFGRCCLSDGTKVQIRPIEATDVLACEGMLSACSRKSLYSRYERPIMDGVRELAARLCRPDPNCELTVVAEILQGGPQSIIQSDLTPNISHLGVAQLIADSYHDTVEYAVLVADPWQNKGLGSAFTDISLRLASAWRVRRIVVEFLPDNTRVIRILNTWKFDLQRDPQGHIVSGQKILTPENEERQLADGGSS